MSITSYYKAHVWVQIVTALAVAITLVMGAVIALNIRSQNAMIGEQMDLQGKMIAETVEGSMEDDLAVGDNQSVRRLFKKLKDKIPGMDVFVFDYDQAISFATRPEAEGKRLDAVLTDAAAAAAVSQMLKTGEPPARHFQELIDGEPYMTIFRPVLNEKRCAHCHGTARTVLGGELVRASAQHALAAVREARNYSMSLGVVGLVVVTVLVYFLFNRLVNRRVESLGESALRFSQGDLTGRFPETAKADCAKLMKCTKMDCPSHPSSPNHKNGPCWSVAGSNAPVVVCPKVKKGKEGGGVDRCEECEVFQKAVMDEIGILARSLNTLVGRLQDMIKGVKSSADTVGSSAGELTAISQQMSAGAEETSGRSNTVATAAEEMSSNLSSVAAAMEQTSTNVGVVATSTDEMASTVTEIAQNTEKARNITGEAVTEAKKASDRVGELGKAAEEIGKVTETITEISDQINLLALNATIEAARAGEAGKGFAVVANEIKELARQTAAATQEINQNIAGIQDATDHTVTEIGQISKIINEVNDIVSTIATAVEEQSVTTKEIANNVGQASQGIQEVNENVAQSSTVSGEIARDIAEVNQAASEMSNSSAQVNMSAEQLSHLAQQLKELVGQFKV